MLKRTLSALIALPLLFWMVLNGGGVLVLSVLVLSLIGQYEFYKAFSKSHRPIQILGYGVTLAVYAGFFLEMGKGYFSFVVLAFLFAVFAYMVFSEHDIIDAVVTFTGFFYVAFTLGHMVMLSNHSTSFFIWYPFILAFVTDTFAYLTGRVFGRTPLIPKVSPNKTVEGSIGGIVGCVAVSVVYALIVNPSFWYKAIFLGLLGSFIAQVGDLVASKIKRQFGIKDFGWIMPGHGGVLDRCDSLIMTTPFVYYFVLFFV